MIKKLAQSIREYKRSTILTPVIVSIEVIMECFIPFITADLIDLMEKGPSGSILVTKFGLSVETTMTGILLDGLLLFIMAGISITSGILAGKHCAIASCGFAKNLREDMFQNVQNFSFENIDKFSSSGLVTRMTTDVSNVQQAFMMIIRTAVRCPFMFIFSLVMAFVMAGKMALVFVGVAPILIFGLFFIASRAMPIFRKVFKKYDALNNSVQENVKGMRVVKSYVREDYEKEKFEKSAVDVQKDFTGAEKILAWNGPVMQFCIYTITILLCIFGAKIIINTIGVDLTVGRFSSLLTYGMQILMSLMMISMVFVMCTLSGESARRICEVLKEESTIQNPQNPVTEVKDGSIDFRHVNYKYAKRAEKNALSDINYRIDSGKTVGIIGGTGSSKSTLITLIPRLYDVTDGEILVGGVNVKDYDLKVLRDQVAIVLQKNVLFSGTIKENLRWGNENATDEELTEACKMACADEFIQTFPDGYDTFIEQGGSNVSGGQKQRLCIARALLKKPKIIIFDDSTSAVDTRTDALIRQSLAKSIPNTTKIIIAQRISSVQDADQIIVMDDGKINGVGTHAELLKNNEIYRDVYESQIKGGALDE